MSDGSFDVTVSCDNGNDYDGRMGVRISSIFVILVTSLFGALFPVVAKRNPGLRIPPGVFFFCKYFGSGVIVATAFIHLLAPAADALSSPCLTGPITTYDWAEGIALMTIFVMFFIELMAARFDFFKEMASERSYDIEASRSNGTEEDSTKHTKEVASDSAPGPTTAVGVSYPPGGEEHLSHSRHHSDDAVFASQLTALFILEFGVIFHSVFIGLTLAVSGDEFNVLYIVLIFHQGFEGLGLGARLAEAQWPKSKNWMPYVLGASYAFTTPIAIAIGLGVRETLTPGSPKTTIINGVFDAISAGILIYTGLVELMAHEFMFNNEMQSSPLKKTLTAFGYMVLGAGLMALLGEWA